MSAHSRLTYRLRAWLSALGRSGWHGGSVRSRLSDSTAAEASRQVEPVLNPMRVLLVALSLLSALVAQAAGGQSPTCTNRSTHAAGVGDIRLGQRAATVKQTCPVVSDTLRRKGEGGSGRVIRVLVGTETVDTWVEADSVWRLDVTTASFRTADSPGVGTPLEVLLRDDAVRGSAGEGWLFVWLPARCGIQFVFNTGISSARSSTAS